MKTALPPLGCEVKRNEPLWRHTSMQVGGLASLLVEPKTVEDLRSCLRWVHEENVSVFVLGSGTNVIFSDHGFNGLVIQLAGRNTNVRMQEDRIFAPAGAALAQVAWEACKEGFSGLEFACGIPGSVGGAVVMNAGTRHGEIKEALESVIVLQPEKDDLRPLSVSDLALDYRTSKLRRNTIITEAVFRLTRVNQKSCIDRAQRWLEDRRSRLPSGPSSGCIFRNPFPETSAGWLIDKAGCKGMRVGQSRVSEKHANFIINDGFNNAADVFALITRVKERVLQIFNIELTEEVEIVASEGR